MKKAIWTKTKKDFRKLMKLYIKKGYLDKIDEKYIDDWWEDDKENTCVSTPEEFGIEWRIYKKSWFKHNGYIFEE